MKPLAWLLAASAWAASSQPPPAVVTFARVGDRYLVQSRDGVAELEWATASGFRYRRAFGRELRAPSGNPPEPVKVTAVESPEAVTFRTANLVATVRKDDLRVSVTKLDGSPLMTDATPAALRDGVITWERAAPPGLRYYGLGARTAATLNLRGMLVRDAVPFLFTTAGYGEMHVAPGHYDFDLERLRRGRYRIDIRNAGLIDYYFYYGPTPKGIFEERRLTLGANFSPRADAAAFDRMVELSLSGVILPVETVARLLPAGLRQGLGPYFAAYVQEVQDRGYPILHPLPFQFPGDAEADRHRHQAMLGDELLLAAGSTAYLPRGIWTNLDTNQVANGKTVIPLAAPAVFAHNGTIVPRAASGTLELHYFPKLAAEFFLFEQDLGDYTQVHAAPAADVIRLEIEAKSTRDFTWVVHHLEGVRKVTANAVAFAEVQAAGALRDRTWYSDTASRNVFVRGRVAAGQDLIVNLSF